MCGMNIDSQRKIILDMWLLNMSRVLLLYEQIDEDIDITIWFLKMSTLILGARQ